MGAKRNNLYDLPQYYDIAFSWNLAGEADFLIRALKWHSRKRKLERVLEPACGTGRMLREFARRKIPVTGYDINEVSVKYAHERSKALGFEQFIDIHQADMVQAEFDTIFDGAYNLVNSMSYLLEDSDIISHLKKTGEALVNGSVYILQFGLTDPERTEYEPQVWVREQDNIKVKFTWRRDSQDFEKKINYDCSIMEVNDHGEEKIFEEKHNQRMWTYNDVTGLISESGLFNLIALYDIEQRVIPLDSSEITKLHIPYFVLKRRVKKLVA